MHLFDNTLNRLAAIGAATGLLVTLITLSAQSRTALGVWFWLALGVGLVLLSVGVLLLLLDPIFRAYRRPPSPPPPSVPRIEFTSVPPFGRRELLKGRVSGVDANQYSVAVFIRVDDIWWVKPYWQSPLTSIMQDDTWTCDVVTGGKDEQATAIHAFLVPRGIRLSRRPSVGEIQPYAVAQTSANRQRR